MKIQSPSITQAFVPYLKKVARFKVLIFVLLIAAVYSYVLISINSLSGIQPSSQTVDSEFGSIKTPRIDESVVKKLEALRDNSVSVKTLFDQARDNPFNE